MNVRERVCNDHARGRKLVVIHGEDDKSVPVANGKELFAAACEPKAILLIKKGNHLLSSTTAFNKAVQEISRLVEDNCE